VQAHLIEPASRTSRGRERSGIFAGVLASARESPLGHGQRNPPAQNTPSQPKPAVENDVSAGARPPTDPSARGAFARISTPTAFTPQPINGSANGPHSADEDPVTTVGVPFPGSISSLPPSPLAPSRPLPPASGPFSPPLVASSGPGAPPLNASTGAQSAGHPPRGVPYRASSAAPPGIPGPPHGMAIVHAPAGAPIQGRGASPRADYRPATTHVVRSRAYSFALDARGQPIELGSGRFAKVYLGEERWLESKTDYRREVVIKIVQRGVSEEDLMRFQMEKELLERVQGHPNIVELMASGEQDDTDFIPQSIRDKVENEFMILERLEMSLEERLKGSRTKGKKDDLLACDMRERIFRVLDYMIPVASAVEYAHLVRNMCHRDIKPANILIRIPNPDLRGSALEVRLADFNVAKLRDDDVNFHMTQMNAVPGTLFFQSPEQETNFIELLVNTQQGVPEVEYFEDFYIQIGKNDAFSLFNRGEQYAILYADRARKRLVLARPYRDVSETNVRARIQKSVGRPADIYSLGATLYYLISGAYANPKTLYDAFHKFIEYEKADENNTVEAYLQHEYSVINSLRAPRQNEAGVEVAPADRFFSYKHYLDGNGELIDPHVMRIIAKCMIRNKPDGYCQAHDLETRGISELVQDLISLYAVYGVHPAARPVNLARAHGGSRNLLLRLGSRLRWVWLVLASSLRRKK
jgi:serine/threonine protein kinase